MLYEFTTVYATHNQGSFWIINSYNNVFELCKDAGAPGENPHRDKHIVQNPHRKDLDNPIWGLRPGPNRF